MPRGAVSGEAKGPGRMERWDGVRLGTAGGSPPDGTLEPAAYERFAPLLAPEHVGAVVRLAAALVGRDDAEDAAQEALMRAWQAWPSLRDHSAARGWLLRITANVCKDWQRGRFGTRRRRDAPLAGDEGLALLGGDPGTSDAAASLDLRTAVNALEPGLRVIVVLRHYAGLDATEIGLALGMPPATVRTRLRRALALLRDRLDGSGHWPSAYMQEGSR